MLKYFIFFMLLSLNSCVYRVVKIDHYKSDKWRRNISPKPTSQPVRLNSFRDGNHCFEPMFFIMSLGVIPVHCVGYYQMNHNVYRVSDMVGWIPAIYPLVSNWKYTAGDGKRELNDIEQMEKPK